MDREELRKKLSKMSAADLVILRWHKKRREAQTCPKPIPKVWWLLGGRGCVAEGTPVWDPSIHAYRPIETMTDSGWVLTTSGPVLASPSYIKGQAELFRVETAKGDVILATAEHQFLTQRGYLPLSQIGCDDRIASLDPKGLPEDDQRCWDTIEGFQTDYRQPRHSDGRQLLLSTTDGRVQPLRQADVLEHNRLLCEQDDSDILLEDIRLCLESDLRSRTHSFPDEPQQEDDQLPPELLCDELFQQKLLAAVQFLHRTYPYTESNLSLDLIAGPRPASSDEPLSSFDCLEAQPHVLAEAFVALSQECRIWQPNHSLPNHLDTLSRPLEGDCVFGSFSLALEPRLNSGGPSLVEEPYLEYTTWERIRTVDSVGVRRFYDLHVPGVNNYLAAGMFHHNSGKTYAASNHIFDYAASLPFTEENEIVYVGLIGSIFDDVKATMIEGKSGLLKLIPKEDLLKWNRTDGELSWRVIGPKGEEREVRCNAYTSEKPAKLRGPNLHLAWIDEYAKFKDADTDPTKAGTTWNNMILALRNGSRPHVIVTGTPTDCRLSKYLLDHGGMKMSLMTTHDNRENLPESFYEELTRLDPNSAAYRQEVLAELIFDNPDALFKVDNIDSYRAPVPEEAEIVYKVLGYDPSVSSSVDADECGLILCAYTPETKERSREQGGRPRIVKPTHAYVLKDLSGHYTPHEQTQLVIQTVLNEHVNDLVFEQNQGVEFVMTQLEQALKDNVLEYYVRKQPKAKKTDYGIVKRWAVNGVDKDGMPFKFMIYAVHATSNKKLRAEMVSTRYGSGQIHHPKIETPLPVCQVGNCKTSLENQMTSWDPKNSRYSPDRLDAMGYCMLHIFANFMITRSKVTIARPVAITQDASQHQAVKTTRRKGLVGVYSMDFVPGSVADRADRAMIPLLDGESHRRNPYL